MAKASGKKTTIATKKRETSKKKKAAEALTKPVKKKAEPGVEPIPEPKYRIGEELRLVKYAPPLARGSNVVVQKQVLQSENRWAYVVTSIFNDIEATVRESLLDHRYEIPRGVPEEILEDLSYFCDKQRHLVCVPYSIKNLHRMASDLGIGKHFFHKDHYDIPKRRIDEVQQKCELIGVREIKKIIKEGEANG